MADLKTNSNELQEVLNILANKVDSSTLQPKTDSNLETTDKTVVGAINELNEKIGDGVNTSNLQTKTDENLETQSKEIVGAINEISTKTETALNTLGEIEDGYIKVRGAHQADTLTGTEFLETESKEVVGAINELNRKLNEDNVIGTWVLNNHLNITSEIDVCFDFTGYDAEGVERQFNRMNIDILMEGNGKVEDYRIDYYSDGSIFSVCDTQTDMWFNDMSRTITITKPPTDTEFIELLYANGTLQVEEYQPKIDENLNTESKEIVGAINEVNGKTIDKIGYINTAVSTNIFDDGEGINATSQYFILDSTASQTFSSGYIDYKVPIVAGENVEFEVDEKNKVVRINATGGGSTDNSVSLIGTWTVVDEPEIPTTDLPLKFTSNGSTYTQIYWGVTGSSSWGIYNLRYQDGSHESDTIVYTNNPSGNYGITHGWNNEAYKTITITEEPDDPNTIAWLGANTNVPKVAPSLPSCDSSNEGQFLRVIGGVPTWVSIATATINYDEETQTLSITTEGE